MLRACIKAKVASSKIEFKKGRLSIPFKEKPFKTLLGVIDSMIVLFCRKACFCYWRLLKIEFPFCIVKSMDMFFDFSLECID
jgi:hypothetical protein